ncbi:hypothetical protein EAE96_007778 [Botrytis aclada]|nr:hypothetical protein EAE96_007778 [Botrytis aclada]
MPVVGSKKYSCEPCIRGHRATKCTHTNRLLVLVRKPGRPMQNCAHELEGCVCGRLGGAGEDWGVDGHQAKKCKGPQTYRSQLGMMQETLPMPLVV